MHKFLSLSFLSIWCFCLFNVARLPFTTCSDISICCLTLPLLLLFSGTTKQEKSIHIDLIQRLSENVKNGWKRKMIVFFSSAPLPSALDLLMFFFGLQRKWKGLLLEDDFGVLWTNWCWWLWYTMIGLQINRYSWQNWSFD